MPAIRSFLALPSSTLLRERAEAVLADLKRTDADVRWESPEKLHITLKFLGNVEPQLLETLNHALHAVAVKHSSFDLVYEGIGAFPNSGTPRVIWIGTAPSAPLASLQHSIDECCLSFGFALESRVFHPHLTIGRVKGTRNIQRLTERLKSITLEPTHTRCTELLMMRSELTPSGSVYSVIASIPLTAKPILT